MLRIREHQTSLSMIRISQTASLVADAQSFYFISFCLCKQKSFTMEIFQNLLGIWNEFLFFVSRIDIKLFLFWKGCSTLKVCESEERVVRSEWCVTTGKLKPRVWWTLPDVFEHVNCQYFLVKSEVYWNCRITVNTLTFKNTHQ